MNKESKYLLEAEEEQFLDGLSSAFEMERESALVREAVSQKIASTDFDKFDSNNRGGLFWNKPFVMFLVFISFTGAAIGTYQLIDNFGFGGSPSSGHAKAAIQDSEISETPAIPESAEEMTEAPAPAAPEVETTAKSPEKPIGQEKPASIADNGGRQDEAELAKITESKDKSQTERKARDITVSAKVSLNSDYDLESVVSNIELIFSNLGLDYTLMNSSGDILNIRSESRQGFSEHINSNAEYYVEFIINKNNPGILRIELHYNKSGSEPQTNYTMDEFYYEILKSEIVKYFS